MIHVANKRTWTPDGTASHYCGRPSALGNPYAIGRDGSRAEVIARYDVWLDGELAADTPARRAFDRLLVRYQRDGCLTLVCWCASASCHADIIKRRLEEAAREGDGRR